MLNKKNKNNKNFKTASKESVKANRRAKASFFNSVNATMTNNEISPKKKIGILTKLMSNQKLSSTASLIENGKTIENPKQKSNVLNTYFSNKSTVANPEDCVPHLEKRPNTTHFNNKYISY